MNSLLDPTLSVLRDVLANSAKASLLACAVALTCLMLRRWLSPSWRHALWCAVFLRLVLPDVPVPGWHWNLSRVIPDTAMVPAAGEPAGPLLSAHTGPLPGTGSLQAAPTSEPPATNEQAAPTANATPSVVTWKAFSLWGVLAFTWLAGTLLWWTALAAGWWRFRQRVLATSTPASSQARSMLAACMSDTGMRARVEVRCSAHIATPAVCGVMRHQILLPDSLESAISPDDLRLLLLHELGHVKRHDSVVQLLASVLLGLHWWNPFLWLSWRQLRHEAEAATDAWVLQHTGENSAPSYGAMLLTLASRACAAGMAMGLVPSLINATSMGRRLKRRILDIAAHHVARRWAVAPGIAVLACLVMAGFAQETAKRNPEAKPAAEAATSDSIGGVIVDEGGQPIAGAEVELGVTPIRGRFAKSVLPSDYKAPPPVKTDTEGRWQLRGVPAGVWPMTPENVAAGKDTYQFYVTHPEFLFRQFNSGGEVPLEADAAFRQGTAKLTLKRGLTMRGVVSDESGKPIAGATVVRNPTAENHGDPATTTDAEGRYELKSARPGNLAVRVVAKGYGTQLQRVSMKADAAQDFTLKSGQKLTLKILDDKDQPVRAYSDQRVPAPLVIIYPPGDFWQSGEKLWTSAGPSADGVVTWEDAPAGELVAEISARGFARVTRKVIAGGEVIVKLTQGDRLPGVTLQVTDADTGAPLTGCRIATSNMISKLRDTPSSWMPESMAVAFKRGAADGEYTGGIREGQAKSRLAFCVRQDGYQPVITPPVDVSQGDASLNVKLKRGNPVEVTVRDEQGNAVPAAKIYVMWQSEFLSLKNFLVRSGPMGAEDLEFAGATGADGRCVVPPCAPDAVLLAVHESGFASSAWVDVARRQAVVLGLYAQVEALVTKNGKPAPGLKCEYYGSTDLPGGRRVSLVIEAVTNAEGRLAFPRVFPTNGGLVREAQVRSSQPGRSAVFNSLGGYRKVPAGMTTSFEIEAQTPNLRQLTGKLTVKGGGVPTSTRSQQVSVYLNRPGATGTSFMVGSARLDDEGKFIFEGVAPGTYTLEMALRYTGAPLARYAFADGKPGVEVTVPAPTPESAGKAVDAGIFEVVEAPK